MMSEYSISLLILLLDYSINICSATIACENQVLISKSSERRIRTIIFNAVNEKDQTSFDCNWMIDGPDQKTLFVTIAYFYVTGSCSESSLTFYEGTNKTGRELNKFCDTNVTSEKEVAITDNGNMYMWFRSTRGKVNHRFKISYKSKVEVEDPFDKEDSKAGVAVAIVLGIVFIGSLFVAVTFCIVRLHMKCRNQESQPSELTGVTNLRAERLREKTLNDDFDFRPRLVRNSAMSSSTERILDVQPCRGDAFD